MEKIYLACAVLLLTAFLVFSSCGGGGGTATTYSIGGTVSGLSGTVVLQNNLADDLTLTADGTFTFSTKLANAAAYSVTVLTNPTGQTCTVADGSGTVSSANVTNVTVTCANAYSVGGTVSGLSGTVVLQNNLADDLTLTADGTFTFSTKLANAAAYSVTVLTNPTGQTCTVASGSGNVDGANVTDVTATCAATTYSVGGTITGFGGTITLQNNGGDSLTITADGSFTFGTKLADGAAYSVTAQATTKICSVANGSSNIASANVTNVTVTCADPVIFATSSPMDGAIGSIANADAACMSDANKPASGTYKAMIDDGSTRTITKDWVLGANTTYNRSDGTTVIGTSNGSATFTFPLTNAIANACTNPIWTGLNSDWSSGVSCLSWTSNSVAIKGMVGVCTATDSSAISDSTAPTGVPCNQTKAIYCVQQIQ